MRACAWCGNEGHLQCPVCAVPYCGAACQRADWSAAHESQCCVPAAVAPLGDAVALTPEAVASLEVAGGIENLVWPARVAPDGG